MPLIVLDVRHRCMEFNTDVTTMNMKDIIFVEIAMSKKRWKVLTTTHVLSIPSWEWLEDSLGLQFRKR
jgi:hypothetical protein